MMRCQASDWSELAILASDWPMLTSPAAAGGWRSEEIVVLLIERR